MAPYGTSCVLLLLCLGASLAEMVFRCLACTAERQALCPPPTDTCTEIVREPRCGCCPACARQKGDFCGGYTPSLRCYPQPDSELPLEQPVQGQGLCGPRMDPEPPTGSPDAPREHASSGQ
ncbi:unnamed protein product [Gadus morhua 'NCC']